MKGWIVKLLTIVMRYTVWGGECMWGGLWETGGNGVGNTNNKIKLKLKQQNPKTYRFYYYLF